MNIVPIENKSLSLKDGIMICIHSKVYLKNRGFRLLWELMLGVHHHQLSDLHDHSTDVELMMKIQFELMLRVELKV